MLDKSFSVNAAISLIAAQSFLKKTAQQWDIIFADPPYDMEGIEELAILIVQRKLLKPGGIFILEHDKSIDFSEFDAFHQHRKYGKVNFYQINF